MKKVIILLIMLSVTALSFSQGNVNFSITKHGSYVIPYSSKNYYVINFPNQTQSQLYTSALRAVTHIFVPVEDVVITVDNEMISVNAVHRITERNGPYPPTYDVNYTFQMEFKDGRVRINAPQIVGIKDQYGKRASFTDFAISNTTGEVYDLLKREFSFVNDVINRILSITGTRTNDDW